MSDHLLRLARVVKDHLEGEKAWIETREDIRSFVRDLEAAPPPERRTITREEWADALDQLTKVRDRNKMPGPALNRIMEHFRLTVEDA